MQTKYFCSTWGMSGDLRADLAKIKQAGYDGVETGIPSKAKERALLKSLLADLDLLLIVQQWTDGETADAHCNSFKRQYEAALPFTPLLVNSHSGKDFYSLQDNLKIFNYAAKLEDKHAVPIAHEIHRGRPTFSTMSTMALLDALPDLKLVADFSHWCCVHESLLQNQQQALLRAAQNSVHIHARVGYMEGPQIPDPRDPAWQQHVDIHLGWWQETVDRRQKDGSKIVTICPEFGPAPYMLKRPFRGEPIAEQWEINLFMMRFLKKRLKV